MSTTIRRKIQILKDTSEKLSKLTKQTYPVSVPKHIPEVERYDEWLLKTAKELSSFADTWEEKINNATSANITNMTNSFNYQYLALQQEMQHENRQFTLVSNIMKNKHDTAKNAINNIR